MTSKKICLLPLYRHQISAPIITKIKALPKLAPKAIATRGPLLPETGRSINHIYHQEIDEKMAKLSLKRWKNTMYMSDDSNLSKYLVEMKEAPE